MKPKTTRERWMLVLIPAAVVLIVYGFFIRGPLMSKLDTVSSEAERLRADPVAPADNARLASQRDELILEEQQIDARIAELQNSPLLPSGFGRSASRSSALREITGLMERHRLRLNDQGQVSLAEAGAPNSFEEMIANTRAMLEASAEPTYRRFRFTGRYQDAYMMLRDLAESGLPVIPASLRMERIEGSSHLRWELVVWM